MKLIFFNFNVTKFYEFFFSSDFLVFQIASFQVTDILWLVTCILSKSNDLIFFKVIIIDINFSIRRTFHHIFIKICYYIFLKTSQPIVFFCFLQRIVGLIFLVFFHIFFLFFLCILYIYIFFIVFHTLLFFFLHTYSDIDFYQTLFFYFFIVR